MAVTDNNGATDDTVSRAGAAKARTLVRFIPVLVLLAGFGLAYALGLQDYLSLQELVTQRDRLMALVSENTGSAAIVFFLIYVGAVAFSFPAASVLTIIGGFLFGWLVGGILTVFAATVGATALFLAARFACGDLLKRRTDRWLGRFAEGFRENAFGYLLVLRLAPIFPFFVVNIAPAFFDIGLRHFIAATFLGIIPATFAYAYLGAGLDNVIQAAAKAGHTVTLHDFVTPQITAAFIFLAVVAAVSTLVRKLRARRTKPDRAPAS